MRYEGIVSIQSGLTAEIGQLPQEMFQNAMAKLERRWSHCVDANRMYFEGDKFWNEYE